MGAPPGCQTAGGGGLERQPNRAVGILEGGGDSDSADNGGD